MISIAQNRAILHKAAAGSPAAAELGNEVGKVLDKITPMVLTLDEAPNIGRVLERLSWAPDLVVVDSNSSDDTLAIVARYPNARAFKRTFDDHAGQWNFALEGTGIATEWILALDADYIVTEGLLDEIRTLSPAPDVVGYRARFKYCINGRPLRGAAYPPVVILYRRAGARYVQDGHTQRIRVGGRILDLKGYVLHDDRKPIKRWFHSQLRYQQLEAEKLIALRFSEATFRERIRKLVLVAPIAMFFVCMFAKGNVFDGRAGVFYALQRTVAECILSLLLLDAILNKGRSAQ